MSPTPGLAAPCPDGANSAVHPAASCADGRVVSGEVYAGAYQVGARLGLRSGRWFAATRLSDGAGCWLRASAAADETRRTHVLARLAGVPAADRQVLLEARDGAERVEIWTQPDGPSLRTRIAERTLSLGEVTAAVRALTETIAALHAQGLGHFSLTPDAVHVTGPREAPRFTLAGFDALEEIEQAELVPIAVDAFSAPPEAAGLFKHSPGPQLAAWDWWSLGRLAQEAVLGFPVAQLLPDTVRMGLPTELSSHAEAMLFERNVGMLRAGGVELMEELGPRLEVLLRGLLASAPEGRWGEAEVREWLAGQTPKERYQAPRHARFFRIGRRCYTVPEAAHVLQEPGHCAEAVRHVFAADERDTLMAFLRSDPTQKNALEQLRPAFGLEESPAMRGVGEALRREIVAATVLHTLAAGEFRWRGRPIAAAAAAMLEDPARRAVAIAELKALAAPPVVHLLKRHDHSASVFLEATVKAAIEAEQMACQFKLERLAGDLPVSEIWLAAIPPLSQVEATHRALRERYAQSDDENLQKIFATPHPPNKVLVLLAWTARAPARFRYVTPAELKRRQFDAWTREAEAAARLLFWAHLRNALEAGPLLFGRVWTLAAGALGLTALVAVHLPGPLGVVAGLAPVILFAALRVVAWQVQTRAVARRCPHAAAWRWRDGAARCEREAAGEADAAGLPRVASAVRERFIRANRERAELAKPGKCAAVRRASRHWLTWGAALTSWALVALLAAASGYQAWRRPPSLEAHAAAWRKATHVEKTVREEDMKLAWPFKKPIDAPIDVSVRGAYSPTGPQMAAALARGRALVAPYKPETIDALLAIYVPLDTDDGNGALLFFDGRRGTLLGRNGVRVNFVPFPKMWMQVGEQRVFFLEK
ncbi:MAG: hypothetical protein HYV96_12915 [Opitutae bacterium]|nr:hypothetical protein [Opitutae bacterium]